ncbi:MAG TPA: alpha/beta hydrolase [Candidatus Acidoferrales bacterium]|nr:alpha/beta hydrolase [Candidatus Acidoferrales bacterium]
MSTDETERSGKLSRDGQQWFFDWMIQEQGKVFHYQTEGRGRLPKSVRRHAMISKHVGLGALRMERLAREEEAAGHAMTALSRYFDAATAFGQAQHTIFKNTDEKIYLHGSSIRCYDKVRELAPYRIEHLDIEWAGTTVSGNLHLLPGGGLAPCVFYIPGCDQTKEMYPSPLFNQAHARGMHIFSFDGPGQGESNLRGTKLTLTNYEEAASAAIDHLLKRPEIDPQGMVVYGLSFGSYWAMRLALHDPRVKAVAAFWGSLCEKYHLFDEESPRYKQLFRYLTGLTGEAAIDQLGVEMSLRGKLGGITCPVLVASGEFDPRSPIDEVYELFDEIQSPAALWVFSDQYHQVSVTRPGAENPPLWQLDTHDLACDWLADRLAGRALAGEHEVVYVEPSVAGPYASNRRMKRHWYEA